MGCSKGQEPDYVDVRYAVVNRPKAPVSSQPEVRMGAGRWAKRRRQPIRPASRLPAMGPHQLSTGAIRRRQYIRRSRRFRYVAVFLCTYLLVNGHVAVNVQLGLSIRI
jgi:hypothetical protein